MNKSIKVFSPASVANLVCGFDVLGMSLADPADEMIISLSNTPGIQIVHDDEYGLPEEAEKNCCRSCIARNDEASGCFNRIYFKGG